MRPDTFRLDRPPVQAVSFRPAGAPAEGCSVIMGQGRRSVADLPVEHVAVDVHDTLHVAIVGSVSSGCESECRNSET